MKIIVGLGNPGQKYNGTRHNVGFEVLNRLATRGNAELPKAKFESLVAECGTGDSRRLLVWPQTFMNRSGIAASQAATFYKIEREELLVVCDDFHLPVGQLRFRAKGSAGGQKGLNDILQHFGDEATPRLRIGVGPKPPGVDTANFVLSKFAKQDQEIIEQTLSEAAAAVECWASAGMLEAMNRYNGASA